VNKSYIHRSLKSHGILSSGGIVLDGVPVVGFVDSGALKISEGGEPCGWFKGE
jgi:hypothetical protein